MQGLLVALLMAISFWSGYRFGHVAGHLHEKQENCNHVWDEIRQGFEHCELCHLIRRIHE
jgi:hypothetical protein